MGRNAGLPAGVVGPLLQEFAKRFDDLNILEPVKRALAAVEALSEQTTLAQARGIRDSLASIRALAEAKMTGLQSIFGEFHFSNDTALGKLCVGVLVRLRELGKHIDDVNTGIGGTDALAISEAVSRLERLEIALLQLEEEIRAYSPRPSPSA